MAQLPGAFDATQVKDNDLLPIGVYKMAVTKTSVAPSKKNPDNQVYTLEMDVQEGPFMGRKLFTRLNLVSDNQQAKDIAQRELKRIVEACGKTALKSDLDELLGIPFMAEVAIEKSKNPDYDDQNRIKKYTPATLANTPTQSPAKGPWG